MIPLPLATPRLLIDRLTAADAPTVAAYRSVPDIARYQGWTLPYPVERAEALAESGQLALRLDGQLVGDAMVDAVAGVAHAVEVGITLAPEAQGRGLAVEAVTAIVDAAFAAGRARVIAYVDARNEPSLRLFERLGFRPEGRLHHSFEGDDGLVDEVLFGLTADLWRHAVEEPVVELQPHPADVAWLEEALYRHNVGQVGVADGTELALLVRDELGRIAAGAVGVAWAGGAELRILWVREDRRGAGLGRRLVVAFEDEARARGAAKVFLTTHSFQAPALYRRLGYEETGRWEGWPAGHEQIFFQKRL